MTTAPKYPQMAGCFPDFDQTTLPAIPSVFTDESYINDAMPSFQTDTGLHLFINYPNPEDREIDGPRFILSQLVKDEYTDNEGKPAIAWVWPAIGEVETLLCESDDWLDIYAAAREAYGRAVVAGTATVEQAKGILYEVELPEAILKPIETVEDAKAWIDATVKVSLDWHHDDSAETIITDYGDLFRAEDHDAMNAQLDALAGFDEDEWAPWECSHGYAISAMKEAGTWPYWQVGDHLEYSNGQMAEVLYTGTTGEERKRAILRVEGGFIVAETNKEMSAEGGWTNCADDVRDAPFDAYHQAAAFWYDTSPNAPEASTKPPLGPVLIKGAAVGAGVYDNIRCEAFDNDGSEGRYSLNIEGSEDYAADGMLSEHDTAAEAFAALAARTA